MNPYNDYNKVRIVLERLFNDYPVKLGEYEYYLTEDNSLGIKYGILEEHQVMEMDISFKTFVNLVLKISDEDIVSMATSNALLKINRKRRER